MAKIAGYFLLFLIIALAFDAVTGFVSTVASPVIPPDECRASNSFCGPIHFVTSVFSNNTNANSLTTPTWNSIQNQTIVVVTIDPVAVFPASVSSVKDTFGDLFTRQIQVFSPVGATNLYTEEMWIGTVGSSGLNTVTTNWNITSPLITQVLVYSGVSGIGNKTSFANTGPASSPQTLTTSQSGSWFDGVTGTVGSNSPTLCQGNITPMANTLVMIPRADQCVFESPGSVGGEVEVSDNNTALRNGFSATYQRTTAPFVLASYGMFFELLASDREPKQVTGICTISPFNCVTHLNFARPNSLPNTLNKALALNTAFCTGINTVALTTSGSVISVWAAYSAVDLNTTGAKIFLQVYVSTNVPSNTFGSGLCATGGTIIATGYISFPLTGGLTQTNTFSTAINGMDPVLGSSMVANTYYAWIEVTAQGFVSGSLGMDQVCTNTSFGICTISMLEEK